MSRLARRIFTSASLLLFVVSAALCIRSYCVIDFVAHQRVNHFSDKLVWNERILVSGRGGICLVSRHSVWTLPHRDMSEQQIQNLPTGWQHERLVAGGYGGDFFSATKQPTHLGFGHATTEMDAAGVTEDSTLIVFPTGAAMAAFAILPFIGIIRFIKSRRRLRRLAALNFNGMQTHRQAA
jgi:hypothetical protein